MRPLYAYTHIEQLLLRISDTPLPALDDDLISLGSVLVLRVLRVVVVAREGDLDVVVLLKPNDVLPTLPNERGVVLLGDLQNLRRLVGLIHPLNQSHILHLFALKRKERKGHARVSQHASKSASSPPPHSPSFR